MIAALALAAALAADVGGADAGPCSTPRRAAATILGNLAPPLEDPDAPLDAAAVRRALRCIEVPRGMDQPVLIARLRTLQDTLDAVGLVVKPADIPDDANHVDARTFRSVFVLAPQAPRIRLQKDDHGRWMLPVDAVADADDIHDAIVGIDIARLTRALPAPWHRRVFGLSAWQWPALLVVLALALLTRALLGMLATRRLDVLAKNLRWQLSADELRTGTKPLGWLMGCGVVYVLVPMLGLPAKWTARLLAVDRAVAAVCVVWLALRAVDLVATHLEVRAKTSPSRMDDHLVPLTRRITKMVIVVIGLVLALQGMGVDVGSLVAGLGIGGLAVALAAKDTIGNFFGSIAIFLDRPFQIGDWVSTTNGSVEGTVETVGFRSTQIRTIRDTVVTVPNARMADAEIDNWGARRHRRIRLAIGFTRDATAAQLTSFTTAAKADLAARSAVRTSDIEVVAHDITDTAVAVLVHCYVEADTWSVELALRHAIVLALLDLAHEAGLRLVQTTRAVQLEPAAEASPPLASASSSAAAAAAKPSAPAEKSASSAMKAGS